MKAEDHVARLLMQVHTHARCSFGDIQQGLDDLNDHRIPLGIHPVLVLNGPTAASWWRLQVLRWGLWAIGRAGHIVMVPTQVQP